MKQIVDSIPGRRIIEDVLLNGVILDRAVIANCAEFIHKGAIEGIILGILRLTFDSL